jgi:hypothetical protein
MSENLKRAARAYFARRKPKAKAKRTEPTEGGERKVLPYPEAAT